MADRRLRISRDLALPLETVTESLAILAKKGAGKTYTASALIEEMLKAKLPVVVLDPMGVWWGLRSSADGKGPGFPIAIIGGDHGDVPLEPTAGVVCADLVVDERLPTIFDLKPFSKKDRRRFVADFLVRLYQRNRDVLHVVLEEADLFAPEGKLKQAGDEDMLGAVYDIVRRGRSNGIGSTLITQRSASLSKEVLTQAEILIALRTTGPQDRDAIDEWIKHHGDRDQRAEVLGSLHTLPTGEAWVWWPQEEMLKRIRIREKETFDSSATPKPGQTRREPKTVADVDLGALVDAMAATIEKAKAEDPAELRRRLRGLEQQLRAAQAELERRPTEPTVVTEPVEVRIDVPVLTDEDRYAFSKFEALGEISIEQWRADADRLEQILQRVRETLANPGGPQAEQTARAQPRRRPVERQASPAPRKAPTIGHRSAPPATRPAVDGDFRPSSAQQRILDTLAWFEQLGISAPSRAALAPMAGTRPTSGGFKNNLGALKNEKGLHPWPPLVEYPQPNRVRLTADGRAAAVAPDIEPTDEALQDAVLAAVTSSQASILRELIGVHPNALPREDLADTVGVPVTSGGFKNNLGALRTLEVIDYPEPGWVVALPVLFPVSEGGG